MPASPAPKSPESAPWLRRWLWLAVALGALVFVVWADVSRGQRLRLVSNMVAGDAAAEPSVASPTGYAGGGRRLLVPERNERSFEWIAQTQQLLAQGGWRVRHVDYDNAPSGRDVDLPSPYRWWLALIARVDRWAEGRPSGLAVEGAALVADPLLHAVLIFGGAAFVAWRFGALAAALFALAVAGIFPLAAAFLPGAPDARGLSNLLALGSILPLLAGVAQPKPDRWFIAGGVIAGLGLWVGLSAQVPLALGLGLGAFAAARLARGETPAGDGLPWRTWGLAAGLTVLAACAVDYFPERADSWRLESIHPLYGLAWIGAGELLARADLALRRPRAAWTIRDWVITVLALGAVAAVPLTLWRNGSWGFLAQDPAWARLTGLPNAPVAANLMAWLKRDGVTPAVIATLAPLLVLGPALVQLLRRDTVATTRTALALAFGPFAVTLAFACWQLSWWSLADGAALAVMVAGLAGGPGRPASWIRWPWLAAAVLAAAAGLGQLRPSPAKEGEVALTGAEAEQLIERDLAHWLEKHAGGEAVVYAPPRQSATLSFYGGLRAIGTLAPGNRAGLGSTIMIAAVKSMDEARELLNARGVRFVILPSWDRFFDDFPRLYLDPKFANWTGMLVPELRRWNLPAWLRPVPYQLPLGGGFEGQSVRVFEVVDEQAPPLALGRLAEYFVETGDLDRAAAVGEALKRFPGDLGALAARAQVELARGDGHAVAQTVELLKTRLASRADRFLPWDRRVSLTMVLARGGQVELAREQAGRCFAEADDPKLRSLTTGALYGLEVLGHAFGLKFTDPRLEALALDLLPADLRGKL